jgi:hypothetical protein
MKMKRSFFAALLISTLVVTACDLQNTPTKVGSGQLYQSGDGRYDAYFTTVHQEQVAAGNWPDESKAARRPIVTALDLKPGASNGTIASAAREKKGDAAVARAADESIALERERAKKLNAIVPRLEELEKKGEELRKQAVDDRRNMAADKADEAKVAKKEEVKREISAALDAVSNMLTDAKRGAREAEDLAAKLHETFPNGSPRAEATKEEKPEKPEKEEKKEPPKKPAKKPSSGEAKKQPPPKAEPAEPPPKKEPPPPKPSEEVFTP